MRNCRLLFSHVRSPAICEQRNQVLFGPCALLFRVLIGIVIGSSVQARRRQTHALYQIVIPQSPPPLPPLLSLSFNFSENGDLILRGGTFDFLQS